MEYKILSIIPADNWWAKYEDDNVEFYKKLMGWAHVEYSEQGIKHTMVSGMVAESDDTEIYDLCCEDDNCAGYKYSTENILGTGYLIYASKSISDEEKSEVGSKFFKKINNKIIMKCIFHNEKTPSLSIDIQNDIFHCFSCGKNGNLEELILALIRTK